MRRRPGASADHYAVAIGAMRAAVEPHTLFTSPRDIENMQNGGVLDAPHEDTDRGTPIKTFRRNGDENQKWYIEFDNTVLRIRLVGGRCIAANPDKHFGFRMSLADCSDSPT